MASRLTFWCWVAVVLFALVCRAGWLDTAQPGFVIQTFTTYDPITGNNTGTITTNGKSFQFAGDNTGLMYLGGPGAQFRGKNDGKVYVDGNGGLVMGTFASLSVVTNQGWGSLLLGNLSVGQKALITSVGNASLLLGAGTVSNSQAIVVGDGNVSHGLRSVTADSFWGMGSGFHGDGSGLTGITAAQVGAAALDHTQAASTITGLGTAATNNTSDFASAAQGARADQAGYTPEGEFGFDGAGKITSYSGTNAELRIPPTIGGVPVTEIGLQACEGRTSIVRLFWPQSVKTVGPYTFDGCSELTAADMPGATYIGHSAFKNCYKLASVSMPNVVYIEDNAFISCFALTAVSLPSVQTIGSGAYSFYNCTNLVTVSMPVVTSIAAKSFLGCTKLASVYFSGNAPALGSYVDPFTGSTISGVFEGTAPAIAYYPQGRTGYNTWGYTNTNTWVQTDNIYSLAVNGVVPDANGNISMGAVWKTNVWWAYATSVATERSVYTNIYLGR